MWLTIYLNKQCYHTEHVYSPVDKYAREIFSVKLIQELFYLLVNTILADISAYLVLFSG